MPRDFFSFTERLGWVSVTLSVFALWLFCWSGILAYLAVIYEWSPNRCQKISAPLGFLGVFLFFFANEGHQMIGILLTAQAGIAGLLCRKMAYPRMTEEEFQDSVRRSHEPPRIFPR